MPLFDFNFFKKSIKDWIRSNPNGTMNELRDFCEDLIPVQQYAANEWLIDQTLSWYRHILDHREMEELGEEIEACD